MRFEFLEGLVRIANAKYKETGAAATVTESFKMLLDECISENFEFQPWQEFRNEQLWTLKVQDVFHANLDGIRRLMTAYLEPGKKIFKLLDALRMFCKDTACGISENEFYYCYGMSKMTVPKESMSHYNYFTVQLAEFMELIGRLAEFKYRETSGLGLHEKIEFLLDIVFQLVGFARVSVNINIEDESASDDEY